MGRCGVLNVHCRYMDETLDRAWTEKDYAEDAFGTTFVEDTIRDTVYRLAQDLKDGTLSRSVSRGPFALIRASF